MNIIVFENWNEIMLVMIVIVLKINYNFVAQVQKEVQRKKMFIMLTTKEIYQTIIYTILIFR